MKRILIINADDLGYTRGVNRAIAHCARAGVLKSATIMASGPAFNDAVTIAKATPDLQVGVHLVLTELHPLSKADTIPGMIDDRGLLLPSPGAFLKSLIQGKISRDQIYRELDLQVSKVLDQGLRITHLDSHKHVHLLPPVIDVAAQIARRHSIKWIRNPFDSTHLRHSAFRVSRGQRTRLAKQHLKAEASKMFLPYFFKTIRRFGLRTPDHFYGVSLTGIWNEACLDAMLRNLPPGVNEWMVHPGECDLELRSQKTRLLEQREGERDLLISPLFKDLLLKYTIQLSDYRREA